jgi:hypothetical protein
MPALASPVTDERLALREFLCYQQSAFLAIAFGLTDEQARSTPSASALSIGGVIKHATGVQKTWMVRVAAAPDAPPPDTRPFQELAAFHKASDGVYGAPRILADLRDDGERVSRKTVAPSLRRQGLAGISPRTFAPATTVVDADAAVPKDLVGRRFDTGELDRVWISDITYLRTGEGWLYLCAVRDGCSRRVIGWAIDEHLGTDLVQAAVAMAVAMRGELAGEVILHADRAAHPTPGCPVVPGESVHHCRR